ncbi:MAG: hypothetical protein L0Z50_08120 [Verrucomicrobiales bacterium]|nr:hypothetical protein [Verrucomicrobiales bacterium]
MNPHLQRDLKTICLKCLEKEPARRYQTAQELADELGRFLADKPILAHPVSRPEKVWRWCRRKPLVASLIAAIVLAILVGFVGVAWQGQRAIQARDVAQRRLYAAQMSQAFRAWDAGNLRPARALLDAQRPQPGETDLRGADWRWLWSLCQGEAKAVLPTQGEMTINTAEPSPDGRWLATAGWHTNVVVYDLTGREQPRILRGHTRLLTGLRSVAFSPDGRRLASASGGIFVDPGPCELFLWDLATTNKTVLEGHNMWLWAVAFSPDGAWLASACLDGTIGLWDATTGRNLAILRGHHQPAYALAFSRDGHWLFSGGQDGTVRRWDVAARREVGQPLLHELPVYFIDVAPDARTIAVSCTDHYLRLWDAASGRVRTLRYNPGEPVMAPVFSPDGHLLAFGTGNNIRVWDMQTEHEKTVLRGSAGRILNLRFLPDGRQLVSANEFDSPMLWDIDRPEKVITLKGFGEGVRSMAVSSGQSWLAVGSGDVSGLERPGEVIVFDLATRRPLLPPLEHPQGVNSVSLPADGRLLATGCPDGSVRIFTMPDGRLIGTLTNAVANRTGNLIFSPNGQSLVTCGGAPAQLAVWNTATWQARTLLRDPPANHSGFAFSDDGSLLVTPMGDNFAIVWNMPSGTTNHLKFNSYVGPAASFSSDGSMLALALGFFDIALLKVKTWERLGTLKGHEHVINWTAFAPDGKILASVAIDGSVRLWSVPGCEEVAVLYDHLDATGTVAFTPDGQWLISGSADKTVKLRRLPSFEEIQTAESAAAARRKHP